MDLKYFNVSPPPNRKKKKCVSCCNQVHASLLWATIWETVGQAVYEVRKIQYSLWQYIYNVVYFVENRIFRQIPDLHASFSLKERKEVQMLFPEVAHVLSFYPRRGKLSLFSLYGQCFPR